MLAYTQIVYNGSRITSYWHTHGFCVFKYHLRWAYTKFHSSLRITSYWHTHILVVQESLHIGKFSYQFKNNKSIIIHKVCFIVVHESLQNSIQKVCFIMVIESLHNCIQKVSQWFKNHFILAYTRSHIGSRITSYWHTQGLTVVQESFHTGIHKVLQWVKNHFILAYIRSHSGSRITSKWHTQDFIVVQESFITGIHNVGINEVVRCYACRPSLSVGK